MSLEHIDNRGKSTSTGKVWAHRIHIDPDNPTRIIFSYHLEGVIDFKGPLDPNLKEISLSAPLPTDVISKVWAHNRVHFIGINPSPEKIRETNAALLQDLQQSH